MRQRYAHARRPSCWPRIKLAKTEENQTMCMDLVDLDADTVPHVALVPRAT